MKTLKQVMWLVTASFLVLACGKPAEPVSTFDLEKAKAGIAEANQKLMSSFNEGDSVGFVSLYHSQAIVMPDNDEPVTGDKMLPAISGAIKMGLQLKFRTNDVWGNADVVVEEGTFEMTDKAGTNLDHGKYIVLWKEEAGQWKIFRDIWNSNVPPPAPPDVTAK